YGGGLAQLPLPRPAEQGYDLSRTTTLARLVHQRRLCVVDDLHHLVRPALSTKSARELRMRVPKHHHQTRYKPAGHDANFLHHALLDPVQELIGFAQQSARRHCSLTQAMPPEMPVLFFDRLLKHALQPTISAGPRPTFHFRRIAQSA